MMKLRAERADKLAGMPHHDEPFTVDDDSIVRIGRDHLSAEHEQGITSRNHLTGCDLSR